MLSHPDDNISRAFLTKSYSGDLNGDLPAQFVEERDTLVRLPIYELTEQLYGLFKLNRMAGQSGYICAFYDQVASYVGEHAADIYDFLKEWDATLCSKTIQCPDINGIRIISIHKSKGLEFDHVIIPFCDWRMEFSDVLWCQPDEPPFNKLPLVPVDYSEKGMSGTIYETCYNTEHRQNIVDNLNLLYVAFTRASRNLFVMGRRNASNSRSALVQQTLLSMQLEGAVLSGQDDNDDILEFTYGKMSLKDSKKVNTDEKNPFLRPSAIVPVTIEVLAQKTAFKQSNKSREFSQAKEDDDQAQQNHYIQMGNVLHNVFSHIRTARDIDLALKQMELDGIIYDEHITRQRIENMIRKRLASKQVTDWFSDRWQLYNECTILLPDGQEKRPDRVMTDGERTIVVDFKFGHPREEYLQQVREYMDLLRQMGHRHVEGYLWFVYSNEITEVR